MTNIAVIPARGGSKRIPRKNIKNFCGKPIISYSIEAAQESGCFDRVIVSTDDQEIAEIARDYGAEVPFYRPHDLSEDFSVVTDVVIYTILEIEKLEKIKIENVCLIYATAPLIQSNYIKDGYAKLTDLSNKYFAIGVTTYAFPVLRALTIHDGEIRQLFDNKEARSQDLDECYHDAAHFCWGRRDAFIKKMNFFSNSSVPIIIPRNLVQDIDSIEDWEFAELLYRVQNNASS